MRTGFARLIRLLTAVGLVAGLLGGPLAVPSSANPVEEVVDFVNSAPEPPTDPSDPQIVDELRRWGYDVAEWVGTEIDRRVG